jgi:Lipopolysaccharide kinase (Kdo/WaaP) family
MVAGSSFLRARVGDLRILHRAELAAEHVARAIEAHRRNAQRGREACEHWGPASSVSRIALRGDGGVLDLAVKWNHPRGLRAAVAEWLLGSRAARAVEGAERLAGLGVPHPEAVAIAERRAPGRVLESFLLTRFLVGSTPLPALMPTLLAVPKRRRALAFEIGRVVGSLHAAGLDHGDLKHSNLLVTADDRIALLDLDSLVPPRRPTWRRRVRALGQLEAYATDLYPNLPRTDRARVLRAYFEREPSLRAQRRRLALAVREWVERRLARWRGRDRELHIYYPLAPRTPLAATVVDVRSARCE